MTDREYNYSPVRSKQVGQKIVFHVRPDPYAPNPRKADDNLTEIVGWHSVYAIGDTKVIGYGSEEEFLQTVREADTVRPLYVCDQAGMAFSTRPFPPERIGYVAVRPERVKELGLDASDTEAIEQRIDAELAAYQKFMNGDLYEVSMEALADGYPTDMVISSVRGVGCTADATLDEAARKLSEQLSPDVAASVNPETIAAAEWSDGW